MAGKREMIERKWLRVKTFLRATIYFNHRQSSVDCIVRDISDGGARLAVSEAALVPESFEVHIPQKNRTHTGDVRWRRGEEMGLEFHNPALADEPDTEQIADLLRRVKKLEAEVAALRRVAGEIKALPTGSGI
jgi:hypothetical protein